MDWNDLAQDRVQWVSLVNMVKNKYVEKFLSSCTTCGVSRKAVICMYLVN
jgi:hypothetical protein